MRTVWDEPALGFLPLLECQLPLSSHLTLSSVLCTSCVGFTTVVGHFSTLDGTFPMTFYCHPGSSSVFTQGCPDYLPGAISELFPDSSRDTKPS